MGGRSVEREWAEAVSYFVQKKVAKLGEPGFGRFAENWLLVYDNWPLLSVRRDSSGKMLYELLGQIAAFERLDRVFILSDHELCDISPTGTRVCSLNKLWS